MQVAVLKAGLAFAVVSTTAFADTALPLGDGKIADQPTVGYVYRCGRGMGNGPPC